MITGIMAVWRYMLSAIWNLKIAMITLEIKSIYVFMSFVSSGPNHESDKGRQRQDRDRQTETVTVNAAVTETMTVSVTVTDSDTEAVNANMTEPETVEMRL